MFAPLAGGALLTAAALTGSEPVAGADALLPTPDQLMDQMTKDLEKDVPPDVDTALKKRFEGAKRFAEVQLLFDILSWRTFVALSRPTGPDNRPLFDGWKTDEDAFPPDGSEPAPWGQPGRANLRLLGSKKVKPGDRALVHLSSVGRVGLEPRREPGPISQTEVPQAFSNPIWDQNGFMVRYEILLNEDEYNYVRDNKLYNVPGQIDFTAAGKTVCFPYGAFPGDTLAPVGLGRDCKPGTTGAIELKLAWKVLKAGVDLPERFLTARAKITNFVDSAYTPKEFQEVTVGLVGMHIAHKTKSSPQWVWSTFAHVDNLQTNDLETFNGKPIPTLFNNPQKPYLAVNSPSQKQEPFSDGQNPTQVTQLVPTPKATQELNRRAQAALGTKSDKKFAVLRYYELLGTQWPTQPGAAPTPGGPATAPGSVTNKSGGKPVPTFLVNPIMETYFQAGNQPATNQEEGNPPDATPIFATESCIGCHSSAPTAYSTIPGPPRRVVSGPQLSGDFSWLLSQRAKFPAPAAPKE
ncbi:hypothetical protein [Gemmata massiliana]|nr:hypothetical protein [Gemmata massiliana]